MSFRVSKYISANDGNIFGNPVSYHCISSSLLHSSTLLHSACYSCTLPATPVHLVSPVLLLLLLLHFPKIPGRLVGVDATESTGLAERFEVKGFPTVKYFKFGVDQFKFTERVQDKIVEFMLELVVPLIAPSLVPRYPSIRAMTPLRPQSQSKGTAAASPAGSRLVGNRERSCAFDRRHIFLEAKEEETFSRNVLCSMLASQLMVGVSFDRDFTSVVVVSYIYWFFIKETRRCNSCRFYSPEFRL